MILLFSFTRPLVYHRRQSANEYVSVKSHVKGVRACSESRYRIHNIMFVKFNQLLTVCVALCRINFYSCFWACFCYCTTKFRIVVNSFRIKYVE